MSSELPESILQRISDENRARACELTKTSPELEEGGMTALDWLAEHGDGIYRKAARLVKAIAEAE